MPRPTFLVACLFAAASTFVMVACNLKANSDCAQLTNDTPKGAVACGSTTCAAETYCSNPAGGTCSAGCTSDDNCGANQTCDLSSARTDLGGNKVGSCATHPLSSSASPCSDTSGDGGAPDGGDAGAQPKDAGRD